MKTHSIFAAISIAALLTACGGGGGGGAGTGTTPAVTGPLAQYQGAWNQGCSGHIRETTTLAASADGNTLTMNQKTEFFGPSSFRVEVAMENKM